MSEPSRVDDYSTKNPENTVKNNTPTEPTHSSQPYVLETLYCQPQPWTENSALSFSHPEASIRQTKVDLIFLLNSLEKWAAVVPGKTLKHLKTNSFWKLKVTIFNSSRALIVKDRLSV